MTEMEPPKSMRKSPPELLNKDDTNDVNKDDTNDERNQSDDDDQTFHPMFITTTSLYLNDIHHRWLSILLKTTTPINPVTLNDASLHSCFAHVVKK